MGFQLLIDWEVYQRLQSLSKQRRQRLLDRFCAIRNYPGHYSDHIESDSSGRRLDVCMFDGYAICYWTDAADRHVKIMKLVPEAKSGS